MDKRLRAVLIIPYFGKVPDYFHLWLKSAEANPDFDFFIYSDLSFPISEQSNVKIKYTTFEQLKGKIKCRLGEQCKVRDPYKLCDYKPTYGYLFAEDIADYDFWGICDIDLIFGNIGKVITQEVLRNNDKLFMHGHFCLLRNNEKMNRLFYEKYPRVVDFDYTSNTNYSCHFDENGTIAYAPDNEKGIRFCFPGSFYDVPWAFYPMLYQKTEACAIWEDGKLMLYWDSGTHSKEIMYIHLQKRRMFNIPDVVDKRIVILRNYFLDEERNRPAELLAMPINCEKQNDFSKANKAADRKSIVRKLRTGALKFRFFRAVYRWKSR